MRVIHTLLHIQRAAAHTTRRQNTTITAPPRAPGLPLNMARKVIAMTATARPNHAM